VSRGLVFVLEIIAVDNIWVVPRLGRHPEVEWKGPSRQKREAVDE
jgi:hypothetical protein